jgi:hypothetical protein
MGLGPRARLAQLGKRLSQEHRYSDIAVQFHVAARRDDGELCWTSTASPVYGGKWDKRVNEYTDDADEILHLPCSAPQFEYVESRAAITEFSGGRGVGKSNAGQLVACANVCDRPFIDGRVVSPTAELYRVQWDKWIPLFLETGWLLPEPYGVRLPPRSELWFWNGVVVQFRSAHKPDRLRSWGGGWAIVDESQDVTTKAIEILLFCLREGGDRVQLYHQLTPAPGEPLERHDNHVAAAAENPADAKVIEADSRQNCFVSHKVYDIAERRMSRDTVAIEVMGDWETVRRLAAADAPKPVFPSLVDEYARYEAGETDLPHVWQGGDFWIDVTRQVVQARLGVHRGFSWNFIGGVDPGTAVPNCCTISKIFRRRSGDQRNVWVHWDFFEEKGHCGHLGEALIEAGYRPSDVVIVPDFTAWSRSYTRDEKGSAKGKGGFGPAAARLLQQLGFYVARRANPRVPASVADVLEKLDPAVGTPRLHFRLPETGRLFENMASVIWDKGGKDFDPSVKNDPTDSGRYGISMFDPAAKIVNTGTRLYVSKR